jgi:hypothetical protein
MRRCTRGLAATDLSVFKNDDGTSFFREKIGGCEARDTGTHDAYIRCDIPGQRRPVWHVCRCHPDGIGGAGTSLHDCFSIRIIQFHGLSDVVPAPAVYPFLGNMRGSEGIGPALKGCLSEQSGEPLAPLDRPRRRRKRPPRQTAVEIGRIGLKSCLLQSNAGVVNKLPRIS